jgi:hypothetical protein
MDKVQQQEHRNIDPGFYKSNKRQVQGLLCMANQILNYAVLLRTMETTIMVEGISA